MRIAKVVVAALALLGFGAAQAQDAVVVREPSPMSVIARDAVSGAVLGSAVAGGIILYEMGIEDNDDYDWGRTLAWGAGIGLAAGLVWGVVDATTGPSYALTGPVRDGQSLSLNPRMGERSGKVVAPLVMGRF